MAAIACVSSKNNVRTFVDGEAVVLIPDRTVLNCLWGRLASDNSLVVLAKRSQGQW